MAIQSIDLAVLADPERCTRSELIAEISALRLKVADQERWLRVAQAAMDEALSAGVGAVSLPLG